MESDLLGVAAAFAITVGLLLLAVHLVKRMRGEISGGDAGVPLRVVQRAGVGPKQGVALLQVADRVLVVSLADGGVRLLTELQGPARDQVLEATRPPEGRRRDAARGLLRRVLPLLGVALCAAALGGFAEPVAAQAADPSAAADPALGSPLADPSMLAPRFSLAVGEGEDGLRLSGAVGLVVFIGVLTLLPALLLLMTSFTRILIVLQFLRPALGTQNMPPMQLLTALALLLSAVVMGPVLREANATALQPYMRGEITQSEAYRLGIQPFRQFMLANVAEKDLALFTELSGDAARAQTLQEVSTATLVSSFVTSELRTAFQMGFLIFVPFIVVDLIVASVLMSLGMFMLPPMMVSLPFKLLLFVLADGWVLVVKNLVLSFG